jgi:hypothetical protein
MTTLAEELPMRVQSRACPNTQSILRMIRSAHWMLAAMSLSVRALEWQLL